MLVDIILQVFVFMYELNIILSSTWKFFNTQFALTLIGTSVAAFAGVLGAHFILERFKLKDQLLRELRNTNAAIMISFEICNSMLALKNQYVKQLGVSYQEAKTAFDAFQVRRHENKISRGEFFELQTDFLTLNPMLMPSEILLKQVFEETSPGARALTLTNTLVRSIDSLNRSVSQRNELIETWKLKPKPANQAELPQYHDRLVEFYFGLRDPAGHIDQSYPNSVEAICSLTDDCIQFSSMLCSDLVEYAQKLKKRLGNKAPNVNTPNFDDAYKKDLMPDEGNYKDWTKMFVKHDKKKKKSFIFSLFSRKK